MTVLDQIRRADVPVPPQALEAVVRRIVAVADPEQIILFGSAARGEMRPNSDLDLLVVKGGAYDYHRVVSDVYAALAGIDMPVEVVLVTPEQVERYRNSFSEPGAPGLPSSFLHKPLAPHRRQRAMILRDLYDVKRAQAEVEDLDLTLRLVGDAAGGGRGRADGRLRSPAQPGSVQL